MHTKFWSKNLKSSDHLKDFDVNGNITLECIVGKLGGVVWFGCIWLRIGTSGGLLSRRY
jgi:hypothetical protein